MTAIRFICLLALAPWIAPQVRGAPAEPESNVTTTPVSRLIPKETAARSLPFLVDKGKAWIEDRGCVSCHQIPSMLWSLDRAARAGLPVDAKELAELSSWSVDWRHWNQTGQNDGLEKVSASNTATMAFLLLALPFESPAATNDSPQAEPHWSDQFRALLLEHQQKDGSWKAGGQLPLSKRPARENDEVATMWALLALKGYPDNSATPSPSSDTASSPLDAAQTRAATYLSTAVPGQSTEWHVTQFLLQPGSKALRTTLLRLQHPDGSWGWLTSEPGDAYGTGLALYALAKSQPSLAETPATQDAIQRAITFLQTTQKEDGSWPVPSTRSRDKNKPIPTSIYWGTAWAAVGLLEYHERQSRR